MLISQRESGLVQPTREPSQASERYQTIPTPNGTIGINSRAHSLITKAHGLRLWALRFCFICCLLALAVSRKNLRRLSSGCSNRRYSLDNRSGFGRDRFHLRQFYEQLLNPALFMRLGQTGLCHGSIFAQRRAKEEVLSKRVIYPAPL
jgi:hypothetical protein